MGFDKSLVIVTLAAKPFNSRHYSLLEFSFQFIFFSQRTDNGLD
jgi:hypothetical protein